MKKIVLGVESTSHTFGVGIFDGKKILANEKDTYFSPTGGIVPMEAAGHHRKAAGKICNAALERACLALKKTNFGLEDINAVALAVGPGLPPCLLAGMEFAKSLGKPIIPVNHCVAHIEIGKWATGCKDPLVVYVSGGNTQIIGYETGRYRVYGETLDIGLGNALDKFAREIKLPSPGGKYIEELAAKGRKYIELPYTVKGMDITYSGLVTAAVKKTGVKQYGCKDNHILQLSSEHSRKDNHILQLSHEHQKKGKERYIHSGHSASQTAEEYSKEGGKKYTHGGTGLTALNEYSKEDLCFSFQETAFSMLVEVAERALAHTKKKEILLTGGVAQNKRLQGMLAAMGKPHRSRFFVPKPEWCGDNGAMIAVAGLLDGNSRRKTDIRPRWRTDDVETT